MPSPGRGRHLPGGSTWATRPLRDLPWTHSQERGKESLSGHQGSSFPRLSSTHLGVDTGSLVLCRKD